MKEVSQEQKDILYKAIELLQPFDKERESHHTIYFESVDENECRDGSDYSEYDCCDNEECYSKTLKELQGKHADKTIQAVWWANDGDHERIDSCYVCGRPLNSQLTWVRDEFEHYEEHVKAKEDFTESRTAFDLIAIFNGMPSNDYDISGYAKHQKAAYGNSEPYDKEVVRRVEFTSKVVALAQLAINSLTPQTDKG